MHEDAVKPGRAHFDLRRSASHRRHRRRRNKASSPTTRRGSRRRLRRRAKFSAWPRQTSRRGCFLADAIRSVTLASPPASYDASAGEGCDRRRSDPSNRMSRLDRSLRERVLPVARYLIVGCRRDASATKAAALATRSLDRVLTLFRFSRAAGPPQTTPRPQLPKHSATYRAGRGNRDDVIAALARQFVQAVAFAA